MKSCKIWMRIPQGGEMNRMAIEKLIVRWSRVALGALVLSLEAFAPTHAQSTGAISVCVRTSDGSIRMLLAAAARSKTSYLDSLPCDHLVAHCIVNKLGQRMDAKLEHDLSSMRFDSPDRNLQQRGNFLIRLSRS